MPEGVRTTMKLSQGLSRSIAGTNAAIYNGVYVAGPVLVLHLQAASSCVSYVNMPPVCCNSLVETSQVRRRRRRSWKEAWWWGAAKELYPGEPRVAPLALFLVSSGEHAL